jgi:hypothetical protein
VALQKKKQKLFFFDSDKKKANHELFDLAFFALFFVFSPLGKSLESVTKKTKHELF